MLDPERCLFQLPVYRLNFDHWAADEQRRQAPYKESMASFRTPTEAAILASQITKWQCWDFNEVVAWIGVAGFHDVIKAELWERKGERVHRHPVHPFEWVGKLTEVWIDRDDTDETITTRLRAALLAKTRMKALAGDIA